MIRTLTAACAAIALAAAPTPAFADAVATAPSSDPAALEQARAIVQVMFPTETREQTFAKMIDDMLGQFRRALKLDSLPDAGLRDILTKQLDSMPSRMMPTVREFLPQIIDATAVAYTHEYSLSELKDIHAFAETPAGKHYLQTATKLVGDPAVAKVNEAYFQAIQKLQIEERDQLQAAITKYLEAHPDVASKLGAEDK